MIHDVTVYGVLAGAARRWPDLPALSFGDRQWTFAELHGACLAAARRLAGLGVRSGDHVVLWAANDPQWVILQFALARLAAVMVSANTALAHDDLTYLLRQSDAALLIAGARARGHDLAGVVRSLDRPELPHLQRIVMLEPADVPGARQFAELPLDGRPLPPADSDLDRCINMQYTSGTTGFPRGVMLTSRNIVNNAWRCGRFLGLGPEDRVLCQVPLFHCFGCVVAILGSFCHGASVHLTGLFDPDESLRVIERRRVTVVHGVPTMFQALLDHPRARANPPRTVRTGLMAGAACPRSFMQRLIEEWNVTEMTAGFGLTEASPHVCYTPRSDPPEQRCGTVGIPLMDTRVKLVDPETGREAERGELWVHGEQVMLGYYNDPEATRLALTPEGWLRTGDLAERDERGYYRIVGRLKEMINRGGENIYPAEVEEAIRPHPAVAEVAVYGVPDRRLGEEVACAVVLRPDHDLDLAGLRSFLLERIARTKIPRHFKTMRQLPLTPSGKIQRYVLGEQAASDFDLA